MWRFRWLRSLAWESPDGSLPWRFPAIFGKFVELVVKAAPMWIDALFKESATAGKPRVIGYSITLGTPCLTV